MYDSVQYDYVRTFFRKPFWTELNILFLKSLAITAPLVVFLVFSMTAYFESLPDGRVRAAVKRNYIAQIVQFYEGMDPLQQSIDGSSSAALAEYSEPETEAVDTRDAEAEAALREIERRKRLQAMREQAARDVAITQPEPQGDSEAAVLASPGASGQDVRKAIDRIATRVDPTPSNRYSPMEAYTTRKKAYESSLNQLREPANTEDQVAISGAEFTDFGIVRGVRDYEQTLTVANANKRTVKHCIEKYFRRDPTMRGNLTVKFDIHPEGYVIANSIRFVDSDIQDSRVLQCVRRTISRWRNFPPVAYEMGQYSLTQKYIF